MVCSESLSFFLFLFELFFNLFGGPPNKSIGLGPRPTRYQLYFARCNYYQIVNLTSIQSVKVVQKYFG